MRIPPGLSVSRERLSPGGVLGGGRRLRAEGEAVEGVGAQRARTLRDGLSRLAEISVVERYS